MNMWCDVSTCCTNPFILLQQLICEVWIHWNIIWKFHTHSVSAASVSLNFNIITLLFFFTTTFNGVYNAAVSDKTVHVIWDTAKSSLSGQIYCVELTRVLLKKDADFGSLSGSMSNLLKHFSTAARWQQRFSINDPDTASLIWTRSKRQNCIYNNMKVKSLKT